MGMRRIMGVDHGNHLDSLSAGRFELIIIGITIFTDNDDSIDIGMTSGKDIRDSCSISVGLRKLRAGDRKGHIMLGDTRAGRRLNGNGVATDRTLRGGQIVLSVISGTGVHVEHLDIDGCGSTGNRKGSLNLLRLAGGEHSY